jgi:hypothetical protein
VRLSPFEQILESFEVFEDTIERSRSCFSENEICRGSGRGVEEQAIFFKVAR